MKKAKTHYRSIFISDTHLGNRHCQAASLLKFLKGVECDYLYLVGDIFDVWSMQANKLHWNTTHSEIVRRLLKMAKDTQVYYIVGNHDAILRPHLPIVLGHIKVTNEVEHITPDGRKLLVTHGDMFDSFMRKHNLLTKLGSRVYDLLISANNVVNKMRSMFGFSHWSLSKYIKHKTKKMLNIIDDFEYVLLERSKSLGYDGIVVGHIHTPVADEDRQYFNTGDWVENCSWLSEDFYGNIDLHYETQKVK